MSQVPAGRGPPRVRRRGADNSKLMSSLLIDYSEGDETYEKYAAAERASKSKAGPAPAPAAAAPEPDAAADVEKGGVCC